MDRLSYATLERMGYQGYLLRHAPERVLQFGEGNFLRGFVDYFIDRMNESVGFDSKVVVVPPSPPGRSPPSTSRRASISSSCGAGWTERWWTSGG